MVLLGLGAVPEGGFSPLFWFPPPEQVRVPGGGAAKRGEFSPSCALPHLGGCPLPPHLLLTPSYLRPSAPPPCGLCDTVKLRGHLARLGGTALAPKGLASSTAGRPAGMVRTLPARGNPQPNPNPSLAPWARGDMGAVHRSDGGGFLSWGHFTYAAHLPPLAPLCRGAHPSLCKRGVLGGGGMMAGWGKCPSLVPPLSPPLKGGQRGTGLERGVPGCRGLRYDRPHTRVVRASPSALPLRAGVELGTAPSGIQRR